MSTPISLPDLNLRLFIDTNVLIHYINQFGNANLFMSLFKEDELVEELKNKIELVTSDYVILELCEYLKSELYLKDKIICRDWPTRRAIRGLNTFKNASQQDLNKFCSEIRMKLEELGKFIQIEKVMNNETPEFNEYIEKCICASKLQAKDILIITSAIFIGSHAIITEDDDFRQEGHRIKELDDGFDDFPVQIPLKLTPALDFSNEDCVKKSYEKWFKEHNGDNAIGEIIDYWNNLKVIGLSCKPGIEVKVGDYIYIIKFVNHNIHEVGPFKILENNMRNYDTNEEINEGNKVTIKIPDEVDVSTNLKNAMIFHYEI